MPAAEVPLIVAVPFPLSTKVIPAGSDPISVNAGNGVPDDVARKEPGTPMANVVALPDVIAGP